MLLGTLPLVESSRVWGVAGIILRIFVFEFLKQLPPSAQVCLSHSRTRVALYLTDENGLSGSCFWHSSLDLPLHCGLISSNV